MAIRRPPPVPDDGRVTLVALGPPVSRRLTRRAAARLQSTFGLAVGVSPTARRAPADGPAPPAERAEALMRAFADPATDAVLAVAGGRGGTRLCDHLDGDRLRRHPTRLFAGGADAVRQSLWRRGLVSWGVSAHPAVTRAAGVDTRHRELLSRALFGQLGRVAPPPAGDDADGPPETAGSDGQTGRWRWRDRGVAVGPTWGGRLAVVRRQLCAGQGLPAPDTLDGAVLALAPDGPLPPGTALDRLLGALGRRGWLSRVDGLLLARPPGGDTATETVLAAARRQLARHAPETTVLAGVDFGGAAPTVPLPLGATTRLAPAANRLTFE